MFIVDESTREEGSNNELDVRTIANSSLESDAVDVANDIDGGSSSDDEVVEGRHDKKDAILSVVRPFCSYITDS